MKIKHLLFSLVFFVGVISALIYLPTIDFDTSNVQSIEHPRNEPKTLDPKVLNDMSESCKTAAQFQNQYYLDNCT